MLLIEVDGNTEAQVEAEYDTVGELCLECGAIEVYVRTTTRPASEIWAAAAEDRRGVQGRWRPSRA